MHNIPQPLQTNDLFHVNSDYSGVREMNDSLETIAYRNNSTLRIFYNDLTESYTMHWHNAMEIIIPLDNYYDVIVNQQAFHLLPDDILIIPPRELHSITAPEYGSRFVYLLDISFLSQVSGYNNVMSLLTHPLFISQKTHPTLYDEILPFFVDMKNDYFANHEYSDFLIYSHLLKLFATLGQNHIQQLAFDNDTCCGKKRDYIRKFLTIIEFIDTHYADNLNLESIADSSGFSKYHFSRLFKQYTGFTFCDYLNYRRIKEAELLLVQQDCSITEVALQSGFTSISTFNRLFKQMKGCSPSEYRTKKSNNL